jgi:hypothetical protein
MPEILSEQLLHKQGSFRRVRRWFRGKHPELGILVPPHCGLSGDWETIADVDLVSPLFTVKVDSADDLGGSSGVVLGGTTPPE